MFPWRAIPLSEYRQIKTTKEIIEYFTIKYYLYNKKIIIIILSVLNIINKFIKYADRAVPV